MQGKGRLAYLPNVFALLACLQCNYEIAHCHFHHRHNLPQLCFFLMPINQFGNVLL